MNEMILPKPTSRERILEKAAPHRPMRVRMAVMAAALALVIVAMPAMAGYVPAVSELMYQVSPEMAARFTPVLESCTVDGIRMEVVSASIHGATAEVCVSFEDLQGDRISESLRTDGEQLLGKNVFLSGNWGGSIGKVDYDEETGKLIMIIEQNYSFWSSLRERYLTVEELFNGKITVSVDRLYRYVSNDGEWVEETVAQGPWRVSFEIIESEYVGPRDDGVPQTTSPE
jgi:hypothetical protein